MCEGCDIDDEEMTQIQLDARFWDASLWGEHGYQPTVGAVRTMFQLMPADAVSFGSEWRWSPENSLCEVCWQWNPEDCLDHTRKPLAEMSYI